jgi:diamine N-acetyltransferase
VAAAPGSAAITVRRGRSDDASALAAFAARTFVEAYPEVDEGVLRRFAAREMTVEATAAALRDPGVAVHLAFVEDRFAGYATLRRGEPPPPVAARSPVELQRIYVDVPWHGLGVAGLLVATAIEQARTWGGDVLWLGVWERNPRAIRFYEKHGFRPAGSVAFELEGLVQRDLVMARPVARDAVSETNDELGESEGRSTRSTS